MDQLTGAFGVPVDSATYWRFLVEPAVSIYIDKSRPDVGKIVQRVDDYSSGQVDYFKKAGVPIRRPSNPEYQSGPEHVA